MKLINLLENKVGYDNLILLDKLLGLRAWGLILYGYYLQVWFCLEYQV